MKIEPLLREHRERQATSNPERINFQGIADKDIYNITAPFMLEEKEYIFARVESRESEFSQSCAFERVGNEYRLVEGLPQLDMQDPFVTFIEGDLVLGGVVVNESELNASVLEWRTVFYRGSTLTQLTQFFEGPKGMKDIRLKELNDQRILVLTRPQGVKGGRGKIGAALINHLSELSLEVIENAPLLENQFSEEEWGGANEIHVLDDDRVGVLGHIASFDDRGDRHYYALTFQLELQGFKIDQPLIIAERKDFLPGLSKRPDLSDVVFSGGVVLGDGTATLYSGISDADAQKITIQHPFNRRQLDEN